MDGYYKRVCLPLTSIREGSTMSKGDSPSHLSVHFFLLREVLHDVPSTPILPYSILCITAYIFSRLSSVAKAMLLDVEHNPSS